ncbi:MAG: DNA repair protein RecN [Alphaproteobacteria bacterium]|nr:DNA repair protein RecN [Alphaproteobacteria bacterium]
MLCALTIHNIVLIDRIDLEMGSGLTVLTGETGAGKSILLDALALALGGRGDQALVRKGMDSGQVVATLNIRPNHPARDVLSQNEIADEGDLILRRVQYADGRTRAFINDQPVSASLLRTLGGALIEIHGQHDERALIDPATHRTVLDSFGGLEPRLVGVRAAYEEMVALETKLNLLAGAAAAAAKQEELYRHTIEELEALGASPGEEETLAAARRGLMQLEKAGEDIAEADEMLAGQNGPGAAISMLMRRLSRKTDSEVFEPLLAALNDALEHLDRAGGALEELKRAVGFDPGELERTEERLFALRAMARKHQVTCDDLHLVLERTRAALDAIRSGEAELKNVRDALAGAEAGYHRLADELSRERAKAGDRLAEAVQAELGDLKLGQANFKVRLSRDDQRRAATGYDAIAFFVQTNPGTEPGPLARVASGGELSRFLLALKVALAARGSAPVLVFDEIDTGVGGAVADAIGKRLERLAQNVQVLCVTHAPQVAARSGRHLLIEKLAAQKGDFVSTRIKPLNGAGRREEIARMLAGAEISDEARAAASRLLSEVAS